jgi:iron complex outermembrane receptor protein
MLCLLTASLAFAPHAMAQEAPAATNATGDQSQQLEEVTVTGSRIKRRDLESQSPLVTIDSEQLEQRSGLNLDAYLNTLPQYNPAQTPTTENDDVQPSATNTVGISTISLRGLGPNRGLVLIDGHRTTPVNELMVTDINTIPSSMIDRVEIISGGASAVYGADALGGVTNFILKKNFQGAQLDIQDGITQAGDGNETRVTGMIGTTIGDGKGNLIMGTEYYNRDVAYQKNRSYFTNSWSDPNSGSGNSFGLGLGGPNEYSTLFDYPSNAALAASFPARTAAGLSVCAVSGCFFNESNFNSNGSLFINNGPIGTSNYEGSTTSGGYGLENTYLGTVGNSTLGGAAPPAVDQSLKWNDPLARISEPQTRYSFFANGSYDITDKVQFYTNARFADSLTTTLLSVPTTATFGWEASVPFNATTDSPILPSAVTPATSQAALTAIYNAFTANPTTNAYTNPNYIGPNTAGAQHPVPWQLSMLLLSRSVFGAGIPLGAFPGFASTEEGGPITCGTSYSVTTNGVPQASPCSPASTSWVLGYEPGIGAAAARSTVDDSTVWQIETGLKFPLYVGDWTGDVYYSRGQSEDVDYGYGNDSLDRWRAVVDAPDYGNGDTFQGNAVGASTNFGNTVPTTCSGGYYNAIFTGVAASADCQNAIGSVLPAETLMQQDIVEANFTGTLFKLPAGDVSGAVGYQYRRDAGQYIAAGLQSTNSFTDTAIGLYPQGSNNVEIASRDGYAELFIPLVQDLKFLKSWNLDIGGRYSAYDFGPKSTTFKVNTDAQLTKSFRIRGGFNRANRAPNLGELYLPEQEYFTIGGAVFGDPCSVRSHAPFGAGGAAPDASTVGGGPTVLAPGQTAAGAESTYLICQAAMGTGASTYYGPTGSQSGDAAAGVFTWENQEGNPNLTSETANTWTAGFVISNLGDNPWIRGLTGSLDWWQIHINNAIELYSPDYANYLCYGTTVVTTAAQAAIQAASPACQNVPRNTGTGGATTLNLQYSNLATIGEAGVDMQLNWFAQFSDLGLSFLPGGIAFNSQDTLLQYYKTKQSPLYFDVNTNWKDSMGPELAGTNGGAYGYRLTASIAYVLPTVSVNLRWRFLPSVNSFQHASNAALIAYDAKVAAQGGTGFLDYTPETTIATPAWNAFDLSFNWNINKTLSIRGGINNLLDKAPANTGASTGFPTAASVAAACSATTAAQGCVAPTAYSLPNDGAGTTNAGFYDVYGRTFFLGAKATF